MSRVDIDRKCIDECIECEERTKDSEHILLTGLTNELVANYVDRMVG